MLILRTFRFAVTGLATTFIYAIITVCMIKLITQSQPLSSGVAFLFATTFSYLLNTCWTFAKPLHERNLIRYMITTLVGLCMAVVISHLAQISGWNYMIGIFLVSCAVPPINFAMHHFWTYR